MTNEVANNDDSIGVCSFFQVTIATAGVYYIREGCYGPSTCGGTVGYTITGNWCGSIMVYAAGCFA